ncbi:hypothetical protein CBF34_04555 [Vagococcus penaei]|nr:hypothetical protein CBF34_04555 [Vagococcus penaei]
MELIYLKEFIKYLMGRRLLKSEIPREYWIYLTTENVKRYDGMKIASQQITCTRCGTTYFKQEVKIENQLEAFYYCPECLVMGRVTNRNGLYTLKERLLPSVSYQHSVSLTWSGRLTVHQKEIANQLVRCYRKKRSVHLVHAVTGAGKTEMLFLVIKRALADGKKVGLASPRVDVCLELFPRLKKAFPNETITLLYGGQDELYVWSQFVICTTHQLLRFYRTFDLLIVDEIDAFPYADNLMLEYGTRQALKKHGLLIFLTATPSKKLLAQLTEKEISYLPKRYHGYPLPEPKLVWVYQLKSKLSRGTIPNPVKTILSHQKRQLLIFFPSIALMIKNYRHLQKLYRYKKIAMVHAQSPNREELVTAMRQQKIDWLLTTTILERGVTFPKIDVMIMLANHRVYTTASLVQIAGRVGRVPNYPTGNVYFVHDGISLTMKQAQSLIEKMNRE